jgi:hypothetical protein
MINLLPPDVKESYQYARRNVRLVHWVVALGFAFVGLVALSVGGLWYLQQQAKQYDSQIAAAEASLKQQDQTKVQKEVTDISNSLKLAVSVLSKEVMFSQLLKQLAIVTPNNATLSNLNISQVQGAVDITANTTDYNAATQLQVNLSDPSNKIFNKADIITINCTSGTAAGGSALTATQSRYPCAVTIRALFADENPFLFINGNKQGVKATAGAKR